MVGTINLPKQANYKEDIALRWQIAMSLWERAQKESSKATGLPQLPVRAK